MPTRAWSYAVRRSDDFIGLMPMGQRWCHFTHQAKSRDLDAWIVAPMCHRAGQMPTQPCRALARGVGQIPARAQTNIKKESLLRCCPSRLRAVCRDVFPRGRRVVLACLLRCFPSRHGGSGCDDRHHGYHVAGVLQRCFPSRSRFLLRCVPSRLLVSRHLRHRHGVRGRRRRKPRPRDKISEHAGRSVANGSRASC